MVFVFVVLGFMIPTVVIDIFQTEPDNFSFLIVITILIAIAIYMSICLGLFSGTKIFISRKIYNLYLDEEHDSHETPPSRVRYAFIMTMCGIHGNNFTFNGTYITIYHYKRTSIRIP